MGTNKPELVICRGLQASGKTTFAHYWVDQDRANRIRVNRDDLRSMIDYGVYEHGVTEGRILSARNALITDGMLKGLSVVADDTNLSARNVKDLAKIAHMRAYPWRVEDFTDVPLEECIRRDLERKHYGTGRHVGEQVIRDTYNRYLHGRKLPLPIPDVSEFFATIDKTEMYLPPAEGKDAIIIDIDGTVALRGTRDPFDETRVAEDRPNRAVIDIIRLDIAYGAWPVFVSGRTDGCMAATWKWVNKNVTPQFDLHMRPAGDGQKDSDLKLGIFNRHIRDHYNVLRVYDDRNQVVAMWRSLGLTVLQVADGNF